MHRLAGAKTHQRCWQEGPELVTQWWPIVAHGGVRALVYHAKGRRLRSPTQTRRSTTRARSAKPLHGTIGSIGLLSRQGEGRGRPFEYFMSSDAC
jgi:hypothetical protein